MGAVWEADFSQCASGAAELHINLTLEVREWQPARRRQCAETAGPYDD
jgi:hypothetical protein